MPDRRDEITLADLLKRLRRARGLSQQALAERAGTSVRGVSDIERGFVRTPNRDTVTMLTDGLGLTPAERQVFLNATPRRVHPRRATAPRQPITASTLPEAVRPPETADPLIGRDAPVQTVVALIDAGEQLITLTGPPGVGKTRLAVAISRRAVELDDVDVVAFVSLAPARTAAEATGSITAAFEVLARPPLTPLAALAGYLRGARLLLILDNLEQIADGAALLGALRTAAPSLRLLVTSRRPLQLHAERVVPVPPLPRPDATVVGKRQLAGLRQVPSVALLLDRVTRGRPAFRLTENNASAIAAICHAADGLPLALEIVAARLHTQTPERLLEQLRRRTLLPMPAPPDFPERHRTLRDAIGWSVDLLDAPARMALARLSVFNGPFSHKGALAVSGCVTSDTGRLDSEVIDGALATLVASSLLDLTGEHDPAGIAWPPACYILLETIREFGRALLAIEGAADAAHRAHAEWYAALAEKAETAMLRPQAAKWLRKVDGQLGNIRAALEWSVNTGQAGDPSATDLALRISAELWHYWRVRGLNAEGQRWISAALGAAERRCSSRAWRCPAGSVMAVASPIRSTISVCWPPMPDDTATRASDRKRRSVCAEPKEIRSA